MTNPDDAPATDTDAFAVFDRAQGIGAIRDPYPKWAELRRQAPVHKGDVNADDAVVSMDGGLPVVTVLGYDAVVEVLRDGDRFSTDIMNDLMGAALGRFLLGMELEEHRSHHALVQQAFSRREMIQWEANVIVPVVSDHLDRIEGKDRAELVQDLTFLFPVFVIAALLGLPEEDLGDFHRWSVEMICYPFDPALGIAGSQRLAEYFVPLVVERRRDPHHDVISTLATTQLDGESLSDEEIVSFLRFLLEAGAETTYRSSSNLFFGLLSNPAFLEEVRADRSLVPLAIEEALRWEPPLTGIFRGAATDTELAGVEIPAGALVAVNVGAANRDETRWENPDVYDIHREQVPHIAFGYGPHLCLGMHLARSEMAVALNAVLDRLPNIRLDPDVEDVHISGSTFRAPAVLPVLFD